MKKNQDIVKLAVKIRMRRAELDISQERLAELAGCHPNHIGRTERVQADPSFSMILKIARALGLSPKDLMPDD